MKQNSNVLNALEKASIWVVVGLVVLTAMAGMMLLIQQALALVGVKASLPQIIAGMFLVSVVSLILRKNPQ